MKSISEIRRNNLRILIDEAGGRIAYSNRIRAKELKIEYGFIGQLINMSRGIGNSVARKLELIGNKPPYWLDHPYYKKWLHLQFITEEELPNEEILKDIMFQHSVKESGTEYEPKRNGKQSSKLNDKSIAQKDEMEKLIKKIEFIFFQEGSEEEIEIIKKIVDFVLKKRSG